MEEGANCIAHGRVHVDFDRDIINELPNSDVENAAVKAPEKLSLAVGDRRLAAIFTLFVYSNFPIATVDDVRNRRLNAPGTSANWLANTGCTPVDGALTTYYTDIQTGVSEGTLSFASGIQPTRVYEVAPHLTRVGFGSMYFGGIAVNKGFYDGLPPEVQVALKEAGKLTSRKHGEYVTQRTTAAMTEMAAAGLQVAELPVAEKEKWANTLPNVAKPWLDANGDGAAAVLKAYFAELTARGIKPARDWAAEI